MWSQLLIDALLDIPQSDLSKQEMLDECREYYKDNEVELKKIAKFENEYKITESIYWYTLDSFVYRLLNKALRTQNIDIIFKFRFFINGLYHQLNEQYQSCILPMENRSNKLTFYRRQGITTDEFTKIKNSINSYVALNSFFSTTRSSTMALEFSGNGLGRSRGIVSVVFEINIDIKLIKRPYADISHLSHMKENEILFSMGTVFKISDVYEIKADIWVIELSIFTNEDDYKINELRDYLKHDIDGMNPILSLSYLLQNMGQYDAAEKYYKMALDDDCSITLKNELSIYSSMGSLEYHRGNYALALDYFYKAYINGSLMKKTSALAIIHRNFGTTYFTLDNFDNAIEHFEEAIKLQNESSIADDLQWGDAYNCLAMAWNRQANYQVAKDYYNKSLKIYLDKLPFNHPRLADIYNNIAGLHNDLGEYMLAKENYAKALNIQLTVLPDSHPSLGVTYNNIGAVQATLGKYEEPLRNYQSSLDIRIRTLSENHPYIANTHTNIGTLHFDNGNYIAALQSYERSLQIQLISLYPNHVLVATTYNSIGSALVKLRRYNEALVHFEKALEIRLAKLPETHPSIANTHSGLGTAYLNLNQNIQALMHFEKALSIRLEALPPLHKDLAEAYLNIAVIHDSNGDYLKALEIFQECLAIQNQSLPLRYLSTAVTLGNIGRTHFNLGNYDEAMIHHLQALDIQRSIKPLNNNYLSITYSNIAAVLEAIGNYKDALETYEKSFLLKLSLHETDTASCISAYAMGVPVCCRIGRLCNWHLD